MSDEERWQEAAENGGFGECGDPSTNAVGSPEHVALWDAVNAVVTASGGSSSTSVARQKAVTRVEEALAALVSARLASTEATRWAVAELAAEVARLTLSYNEAVAAVNDGAESHHDQVTALRTQLSAAQAEAAGERRYREEQTRAWADERADMKAQRDAALTARAEAEAALVGTEEILEAAERVCDRLMLGDTGCVEEAMHGANEFAALLKARALTSSTALGTRLLEEAREEGRKTAVCLAMEEAAQLSASLATALAERDQARRERDEASKAVRDALTDVITELRRRGGA